jgi:hypothetical protein
MTIIDETLGAELLGALGSTLFYGVTLVQLHNFFTSDIQASPKLNVLVGLVG